MLKIWLLFLIILPFLIQNTNAKTENITYVVYFDGGLIKEFKKVMRKLPSRLGHFDDYSLQVWKNNAGQSLIYLWDQFGRRGPMIDVSEWMDLSNKSKFICCKNTPVDDQSIIRVNGTDRIGLEVWTQFSTNNACEFFSKQCVDVEEIEDRLTSSMIDRRLLPYALP